MNSLRNNLISIIYFDMRLFYFFVIKILKNVKITNIFICNNYFAETVNTSFFLCNEKALAK